MVKGLIFLPLIFFCQASAAAAPTTQDLLIEKLTLVQTQLAPNDSSQKAVSLRLADLLAERGRQAAMADLAGGCTKCDAGLSDRAKALQLYQAVLPQVSTSERGKVAMQVARLQEFLGQETDAIATYQNILKEKNSNDAIAEAHLSLGEIYFKRRDYALAQAEYDQTLALPAAVSKGLAAYRRAWCLMNQGQLAEGTQALIHILKTPSMLSRQAGQIQAGGIDKQFQEEVSRDLATFLSRGVVAEKELTQLFELSPESVRLGHLMYLANELERVGKVDASVMVWRFAQERQARPEARLEGMVHLAQLEMNRGRKTEAIQEFSKALQLWAQLGGCGSNDCKELHARLRLFVTDWHRSEKKTPSAELLKAYQDYLRTFSEVDMKLWAAQVARERKEWTTFETLNSQAILTLDQELKTEGNKATAEKKNLFETALLGGLEVGELAQDEALLDRAYDSYLKLSREQKKALEVRYQRAYKLYQKNNYEVAAGALKEVALLNIRGDNKVKMQAADYALDALVLAKKDVQLESWARELAQVFPEKAKEYGAVARKAVLTQAAQVGESNPTLSWASLERFDLAQATPEERAAYYKNRLILAEKLHKFAEAREAAQQLLAQPGLSETDRQFALTRQSWLSEMALDFATALKATEKIQTPELAGEQKWLRLALFADLAQQNSKPFYDSYLKESKDIEAKRDVAARLVRASAQPLKEMDVQKARLQGNADLIARLYLEIYAKSPSAEVLKRVQASTELKETAAGRVLMRQQILREYQPLQKQIVDHKIEAATQKKLATSLKTRALLLTKIETLAQRAVQTQDWLAQLITLDAVAKQSERFYQEILSLPVPAGLSPEEEQEYLSLLSQQAGPYQIKAQDVSKKVAEFWAQDKVLATLGEEMRSAQPDLQKLLLADLQSLNGLVPEAQKSAMESAMAMRTPTAAGRPNLEQIEAARRLVRENPLNAEALRALLALETQGGHSNMVSYLKARLEKVEKGAL